MRSFVLIALIGSFLSGPVVSGPISDAARDGDTAEIAKLLDAGADVNDPGAMVSPLHFAAMNGHAEAVELLAAHGAILDAESSLGTPLHAAANFGRVEAVRALLAAGAIPDPRDEDGYPPLIRAVTNNRIAVVEALLKGGADVNLVSVAKERGEIRGPTIALHEAIFLSNDEIAAALLAAGAGPILPELPDDLASLGDPKRGRELAVAKCKNCHTISVDDEPTLERWHTGPPLIGIIGRPVADLPGFDYSEKLTAFGGIWSPERVYSFALTPTLTVPGTRMNWAPDRTPEMIADIVAYFVSRAD